MCIGFAEGCPRSSCDTAWLFRYFRVNGWRVTRDVHRADLVVVATCGYDATLEDKSIELLRVLDRKRKKEARLIIIGCLAGIHPERLHRQFRATLIPPRAIDGIDTLINARVPLRRVPPVNDVGPYIQEAQGPWLSSERDPSLSWPRALVSDAETAAKGAVRSLLSACGGDDRTLSTFGGCKPLLGREPVFCIRVARGCAETCSYCAIRFAAGPLRSKPLGDILAELDQGLNQGYKVFHIVADDIGQYGTDIGTNVVELLAGLLGRPRHFELVFTDIHPRYVLRHAAALTDLLVAHRTHVGCVRIPIQSGSDAVLQRMQRTYASAEITQWLCRLGQRSPEMPLETHVLVGFPGETEQDFGQTLALLRAVRFHAIQAYWYSDRPGTPASQMLPKVPEPVIEGRVARLVREFPQSVSCRPVPADVAPETGTPVASLSCAY